MCTDILNVAANVIYPLKISFAPLWKDTNDVIDLEIVDDTLTNHVVSKFAKHDSFLNQGNVKLIGQSH